MTTIAVTGASGQLGRLALAALAARGLAPVALARSPGKLAGLGLEVRAFDYTAPDVAALAGVEVLVLISSSDFNDRAGQHARVIRAAQAAGVGRVIYTSILKGDASPMLLAQDHIATEAALKASGLTCTILRNGWYLENLTGSIGPALAHGAVIGAAGEGRFSAAARADFAEAIAVTAATGGHEDAVYELAGDSAFSMAEFAAELGRQTGKPMRYDSLPEASYAEILIGFGLPEGFARVLADSDAWAAKGALQDDSGTLSRLIGRPTTPAAEAIAQALAAL
ncbi:NAD(P)H-binding protein [Pseudotabrizicola algicola]|uniref:NAD(P)H-binding protein n=1 Tax=Pseudotabrizicola algicola TaxID=2709381 RepID=A0A6B3RR10_9RHOB|nr:NAD(P)H-binding protein [Pseudotabrizicola algicola]NEX48487.1 NAD(P)H-binding protein [Pseudotabrizicola algicola]